MNDKKKHFIAGFVAAIVVALPCYLETLNIFAGLWAALVSGILIGTVKEWCDYIYTAKWDWKDFLATCIGVVVVAVFIVLLHFGKG